MNFLAHLYLSGDSDDIMVGNFIGDFVKGNAYREYSSRVRDGILLHRKIDHFTDHHPVVSESKDILRDTYRHYSGVIVDMFYDHLLAASWDRLHPQPLEAFTRKVYATLLARQQEMPDPSVYMLTHMQRGNWLLGYSSIEGIDQALTGMARRTPYDSQMEKASTELKRHYTDFQTHFNRFFPDLMDMVASENPAFTIPSAS